MREVETIRQGMKTLMIKYLTEFRHEPDPDQRTIETYANNFVIDFERYRKASHDFKEEENHAETEQL